VRAINLVDALHGKKFKPFVLCLDSGKVIPLKRPDCVLLSENRTAVKRISRLRLFFRDALAGAIQLVGASATVPVAASRRLADWMWTQNLLPFGNPFQGSDAFDGTSKAAGEGARAPQSICMDMA
jgi:hypothetical protein